MWLAQLLLPLQDNDGRSFPAQHFQRVRDELVGKFGGLTAFSRAPAEGLWKEDKATISKDDIVIVEVMLRELDQAWWQAYKKFLEGLFQQRAIVIRLQDILVL